MHTRNSGRTSPLVYELEIERVHAYKEFRANITLVSNQVTQDPQSTPSIETDSMANQNSNHPNLNQNQFQSRGTFYPAQNVQHIPQDQPSGGINSGPPTPHFQNRGPNNNQRTPQQQNLHRDNSLPTNLDDRNVNSDRRGNRDRGNPANEDPFFNIDDLRNAIPGYQSPEHVSIHSEYSDGGGSYDKRVDDDAWGYVNRGNVYNARGFEDDEFGYQNTNYVGNDNYGYGNVRNDGYGNNRNPRNNNLRNRNDGYYNNNNNANHNRIPRFMGGGNQGGNQGGYRGANRRDNRRPIDQEVDVPHCRQQPPRGVNDRFRPVITDNDSPIVCERRMFDCKPHYINILPHFNERTNDEPYTHLAELSAICSTIGGHDFALEEVKLRLFQFSLKDKAKQWFLTLPAGSIRTWVELIRRSSGFSHFRRVVFAHAFT
ncbi:GATA zinc finger domain-containing protein 15-like [Helianthus annuus]|uniref:GATA zinc finger domain-containing protein 15-like n=1 Tax=Helianthus annuus TaxID=4232 RepID=UPI000B907B40|nr:GATA zinc finger domain-containing protein 15-like [Helianthus annuus]